ncbi:NAD-dependent epimerase/dehydratase family protein [Psychrobacillus psychrotolerans]|uniref:NAD-dependent epimerase/dehydratase family protein n=1 Tax=Psychrobacillus psychrotolerans TaxID=126156 RepID=UPI003314BD90
MLYITGITGHTGAWLLKRLIKENYQGLIKCVVRKDSDTTLIDQSGLNIEKLYGDLNDIHFLTDSMKNVETVIHISSIMYSPKVLESAIKNNVNWAILVHTTGRYSKYKSASEEYIKIEDSLLEMKDKINLTVLRPTMIYGSSADRNMIKLIDFLYRFKFFPLFGKGENLMQPVHAKDLGNAYYDVLMNKEATMNQNYNLAGKEPISYKTLINIVSSKLHKKTVLISIPLGFSIFLAKVYNKITSKALISEEQVLRMQEDKAFPYDKATKDFGYNPIDYENGIDEEIKLYLKSKGKM